MTAPMTGVRVLEVANMIAAPGAAALMADLGADVIKVEPLSGDILRGLEPEFLRKVEALQSWIPERYPQVFRNQGADEVPIQYRDWIDGYFRRLNRGTR